MKIFPAIDIKNGKCVRLLKGDFDKSTIYEKTPLDQAKEFSNQGFRDLHIVDLDGALKGEPVNGKLIEEICKLTNLNVFGLKMRIQVGGGIRSIDHIKKLIDAGVDRVVLGTIAVEDIKFLEKACNKFKNKIAVGLDVRNGFIALKGWKEQTKILASDFLMKIKDIGVSRIIYTDIERDGTLTRPNFEETIKIVKLLENKIPVVVSGGVGSINDIVAVKQNPEYFEGVIVGKAIYDGRLSVSGNIVNLLS
jgi:phosphoribosylformimino-5-aminoimidazole carboxamide ribotide isomerase